MIYTDYDYQVANAKLSQAKVEMYDCIVERLREYNLTIADLFCPADDKHWNWLETMRIVKQRGLISYDHEDKKKEEALEEKAIKNIEYNSSGILYEHIDDIKKKYAHYTARTIASDYNVPVTTVTSFLTKNKIYKRDCLQMVQIENKKKRSDVDIKKDIENDNNSNYNNAVNNDVAIDEEDLSIAKKFSIIKGGLEEAI